MGFHKYYSCAATTGLRIHFRLPTSFSSAFVNQSSVHIQAPGNTDSFFCALPECHINVILNMHYLVVTSFTWNDVLEIIQCRHMTIAYSVFITSGIPLYGYTTICPFTSWPTFGLFLLAVRNKASLSIQEHHCMDVFSCLLNKYLGVESRAHPGSLCLNS